MKAWAVFNLTIFPGMFTGQSLLYYVFWLRRGYLWKLSLPKVYFKWYEVLTYAFVIGSHIYRGSFGVSFIYFVAFNVGYMISILPDHDSMETLKNEYKGTDAIDWGEV